LGLTSSQRPTRKRPTRTPTKRPTRRPTKIYPPSRSPSFRPTQRPTRRPATRLPTRKPTRVTTAPSRVSTVRPTAIPTSVPTFPSISAPTTEVGSPTNGFPDFVIIGKNDYETALSCIPKGPYDTSCGFCYFDPSECDCTYSAWFDNLPGLSVGFHTVACSQAYESAFVTCRQNRTNENIDIYQGSPSSCFAKYGRKPSPEEIDLPLIYSGLDWQVWDWNGASLRSPGYSDEFNYESDSCSCYGYFNDNDWIECRNGKNGVHPWTKICKTRDEAESKCHCYDWTVPFWEAPFCSTPLDCCSNSAVLCA
jgi:hypothetical protein